MMAAKFAQPFVKDQKDDMADAGVIAEAIVEAASRSTMRFVEMKTPEQQSLGYDLAIDRPAHWATEADDQRIAGPSR